MTTHATSKRDYLASIWDLGVLRAATIATTDELLSSVGCKCQLVHVVPRLASHIGDVLVIVKGVFHFLHVRWETRS